MYVHHNSPEELAEAINNISSSDKLKEEMRQKGFMHIKKFDDEEIARNLMRVYTDILQETY